MSSPTARFVSLSFEAKHQCRVRHTKPIDEVLGTGQSTSKHSAALVQLAIPGDDVKDAERRSDESLMAAISVGERGALAEAFRKYAPVIQCAAFRVLRDASEADDIVQET